jgi:putative phage-type endonuclease
MYKSYGELGKVIKFISKIIKSEYKHFNGSKEELILIIKNIYETTVNEYPKTSYELVVDIVNRFFNCNYKYKPLSFDNGYNGFRNWDQQYQCDEVRTKKIKVPEEFAKTEEQFQKLFATPQPEQRTEEWFKYRFNRITASDTASAIDMNPYESVEGFICKKCDPDFPFLDNVFVFHGKKYEQIATQLYEHIYNNKVTEFGCVPSEKYKILGASPDGICSKSTLTNEFSNMLGTMLEIKCPYIRQIRIKGKIMGEICPYYYYCQVQQQLECCDLDKCDFWQCSIKEYKNREEYLLDTNFKTVFSEGNEGKIIEIDTNLTRGCLLQFLPIKFEPTHDEDEHQFKSKYIYPPRLDMSLSEYDEWCMNTICSWQDKDPEMAKEYYFDRIIYWKIPLSHNVTIKRDNKWFSETYPVLLETWKKVCYYRDNLNELPKIQEIADKRKKFYKMNTDLTINNYDSDLAFMNIKDKSKPKNIKPKKKKFVKKNISNEDNNCDFIDD